MKIKKILISIILTAMLCAQMCACGAQGAGDETKNSETTQEESTEEKTSESSSASESGETEESSEEENDTNAASSGYDDTDFYSLCEKLTSAAENGTADEAISLYEEAYAEFLLIKDNATSMYIEYANNVSDDEIYEKYEAANSQTFECPDALCAAVYEICTCSFSNDFKEYIGDEEFEVFLDYEPLTEQEIEWEEKETELVAKYYKAQKTADDTDIEAFTEEVAPIYVELVALRNEMARYYGYDNYADYADEMVYGRDYGGDEAEEFHTEVKKISEDYYDLLYNSYAYMIIYYLDLGFDEDALYFYLAQFAPAVDMELSEIYSFMMDNSLIDVGSKDDDGRMEGSFTTLYDSTMEPYLFLTMSGYDDFGSLTHEFGHFCAFYDEDPVNVLVYSSSYDIDEIHSNGLELLFTEFYDDIYGEKLGPIMESFELISMMVSVVDGCVYDEFQRRVYEEENLTEEKVSEIYESVLKEYGDPSAEANAYYWSRVRHNFEAPMYYLSYASSAIAALQIWDKAQTDFEEAADTWMEIVKTGAYKYGYMEILQNLGLKSFADKGAVSEICTGVLEYISENSYSLTDNIGNIGN